MKRPVGLRRIILQQNQQTANMKKNCWVYILRNESGEFIIGFSVDIWMKSSPKSPRERKSCIISVRLKSRSTAWRTSIFWIPFPKIRSTFSYDVTGNRQKSTRKSSGKRSNYVTLPDNQKNI